jgi:tRNA threonylcarbamoyladenosine biosynthesis protein TsaE
VEGNQKAVKNCQTATCGAGPAEKNELERLYGSDQVGEIVETLLVPLWRPGAIFVFEGPLGAGKTTLVQAFLHKMGVAEPVSSPTFMYLNSYSLAGDVPVVHHFDLYRLWAPDDFSSLGFEMYLSDLQAVCCVEWPAIIAPLLEAPVLASRVNRVFLSYAGADEGKRSIRIVVPQKG